MNAVDLTNTEDRLLGRILRRQAETVPDVDFLVEDREHYSYGRVNDLANSCAAGFAKVGVERGDTVFIDVDKTATTGQPDALAFFVQDETQEELA